MSKHLTPAQNLASSRQALRDALHRGKQKTAAPKTQQVTRSNSSFTKPSLQVKKTRSNTRHVAAHKRAAARAVLNKSNTPTAKNVQHLRAVLGAWLLRRWNKQPARTIASAIQPVLQRSIRQYPKYALGIAAVGGALWVAWRMRQWRTAQPRKRQPSQS